jgi:hypothetical protein
MKTFTLGIAFALLLTTACRLDELPAVKQSSNGAAPSTNNTLMHASDRYKSHRDYASLEVLFRQLRKGIKRAEVERLLGSPDYCPSESQCYYSSDRRGPLDDSGRLATVGIIVEYRDATDTVTDRLQSFSLGPIGE